MGNLPDAETGRGRNRPLGTSDLSDLVVPVLRSTAREGDRLGVLRPYVTRTFGAQGSLLCLEDAEVGVHSSAAPVASSMHDGSTSILLNTVAGRSALLWRSAN
jgi:hypothetical protein